MGRERVFISHIKMGFDVEPRSWSRLNKDCIPRGTWPILILHKVKKCASLKCLVRPEAGIFNEKNVKGLLGAVMPFKQQTSIFLEEIKKIFRHFFYSTVLWFTEKYYNYWFIYFKKSYHKISGSVYLRITILYHTSVSHNSLAIMIIYCLNNHNNTFKW